MTSSDPPSPTPAIPGVSTQETPSAIAALETSSTIAALETPSVIAAGDTPSAMVASETPLISVTKGPSGMAPLESSTATPERWEVYWTSSLEGQSDDQLKEIVRLANVQTAQRRRRSIESALLNALTMFESCFDARVTYSRHQLAKEDLASVPAHRSLFYDLACLYDSTQESLVTVLDVLKLLSIRFNMFVYFNEVSSREVAVDGNDFSIHLQSLLWNGGTSISLQPAQKPASMKWIHPRWIEATVVREASAALARVESTAVLTQLYLSALHERRTRPGETSVSPSERITKVEN